MLQCSLTQYCVLCSLQDSILSQVQRIVKGEVSQAMKEQQAVVTSSIMQAMRSAASTPIPTTHLDFQAQQASILQLLQQGQLNEAFQQVRLMPCTDLHPHTNACRFALLVSCYLCLRFIFITRNM